MLTGMRNGKYEKRSDSNVNFSRYLLHGQAGTAQMWAGPPDASRESASGAAVTPK